MENRIKDILIKKGMSAKQLSEKVGISPVSLSKIINGKQEASANTLDKIAKILEVPFWQLFTSLEEVIGNIPAQTKRMYAYIHVNGKDRVPANMDEAFLYLKEWDAEQFIVRCRKLCFEEIHNNYKEDVELQDLLTRLCARLGIDCCNSLQ